MSGLGTEASPRSLDVRVSGRVQGVYYRASCQQQAKRLGVRGWVRNNSDGSVSAHVEGDATAVSQLLAWMHEGSPAARVRGLETRPSPPTGEPDFRIAY